MGLDLFKRYGCSSPSSATTATRPGHLGLSQGTVSFHVHGLERHLGVPLVRYERRAVG